MHGWLARTALAGHAALHRLTLPLPRCFRADVNEVLVCAEDASAFLEKLDAKVSPHASSCQPGWASLLHARRVCRGCSRQLACPNPWCVTGGPSAVRAGTSGHPGRVSSEQTRACA